MHSSSVITSTRPDRRHRSFGPRRLRVVAGEANARTRQTIHRRTGRASVAVACEAIGAESVNQDENDVKVVATGQLENTLDLTNGPFVGLELKLCQEEEYGEHDTESCIQDLPT